MPGSIKILGIAGSVRKTDQQARDLIGKLLANLVKKVAGRKA